MRGRGRILAIAAVALAGAGLAAARWSAGREAGLSTSPVQRGDFSVYVEATGRIEAAVAYEIGPPSAADYWSYDLSWMIPEGSRVKAGDVIARFDTTDLDEHLRTYRADLEKVVQERDKEEKNLQVSLKQLQLDLVKAKGELEKLDVQTSVPGELISMIDLQTLRLQKDLAQKRYDFLEEKIGFEKKLVASKLEILDVKKRFSQSKIDYYQATKDKFNVKAPVSGLVVYIPKQNGDRWEIGEGVWMLAKILKVADTTTLRVEADVLEVDSARIRTGQEAQVNVDAIPGLSSQTQVAEIGRIVHERSPQDRSKVFDAFLPLEGIDTGNLRPGMGVSVRIRTSRIADALTIPLDAVHLSPGGTYVMLDTPGGPERRGVTLGERDSERVVVEKGLEEGDSVLLGGGGSRT